MKLRKRIYEIVEVADDKDTLSKIYDSAMLAFVVLSLVPVALKGEGIISAVLEIITTIVFLIDYMLRFATADYKLKKGGGSFLIYPFTPMAIVDLLSILPSLLITCGPFRIFKVLKILRTFKIMRIFKAIRYSKSVGIVVNVFKKQKDSLLAVSALAIGYIFVSALVIICVEPDTFPTFFDAIYWAAISLTTVGYGDIYAVSVIGKIITMLSSLFGIAIVALPAGIVTAGYMDELKDSEDKPS